MKRLNILWISLLVLFLTACTSGGTPITFDDESDSTEVTEVSSNDAGENSDSSESTEEHIVTEEEFKNLTGVYLDAKEVQYNMENNLDKEFFLKGQLRLCDYYNYGYTNESKIFCAEMHPDDGSDNWYLYFSREKMDSLYKELLQDNVNLMLTAKIHKEVYRPGQGNMAAAIKVQTD